MKPFHPLAPGLEDTTMVIKSLIDKIIMIGLGSVIILSAAIHLPTTSCGSVEVGPWYVSKNSPAYPKANLALN